MPAHRTAGAVAGAAAAAGGGGGGAGAGGDCALSGRTAAADMLIEWARQRSTSPRGRRQRRQATILARDVLTLLGGVRSCFLLDAEHGAYASDADALCAFLRERERSSGSSIGVEELCALQVLGITFVASASEARPTGDAADALFVVHRSRLAARCEAANSGPSASADEASSGTWGGTVIVDATPCPGGGGQVAPTLCCDASVAIGLQRGVQVVAAALASQAVSDVPGYTPVCIDLSTTSPTLLTAWLLEYPVGYYVAQPATSNILGGEELVLFSVRAELKAEESQPLWLQLEAPNGPRQPSTLCAFSVPLDLLTKEQPIGDAIQAWCGRVGAVLAPPIADSLDEVTDGSACCVWQSPCAAKAEGSDPRFSERDEDGMGEAGEQVLVSHLEQLPWLRIQAGVVLEQVAL